MVKNLSKYILLPTLFFALQLSASGKPDSKDELLGFFTMKTFLAGRNTPARYLTDRILNRETELLKEELSSANNEIRRNAFYTLRMRKRAIEHAIKSRRKLFCFNIGKNPDIIIDGDLGEWKENNVFRRGSFASFPISDSRRADDGSIWYAAKCGENICFAAHFKDKNIVVDREKPWTTDCLELFFATGNNGWKYFEIIVSPKCGITLSKEQNYTGTGTRIETASGFAAKAGISGASKCFSDGYTVEISVPLKLFDIEDGKISFMLVRASEGRTQRTPVECVSEGHDIFGFIKGSL